MAAAGLADGVVVCRFVGTGTTVRPTPPEPAALAPAGFTAPGFAATPPPLAAQGMVTRTVCVTVSASAVMVVVGAAPAAKTVVVKKEKALLEGVGFSQHMAFCFG